MSNDNSLLHFLRESREKPNVLRDRILKAMSENDKIMVFEGIDDAPVYEEWLKTQEEYYNYGYVYSDKGKSAIVLLYSSALEKADYDFLNNCKFFIDHDYDSTSHNDKYIKTLNCYSIENYLVCEDVISNCLSMDCRLDSSLSEIKKYFLLEFKQDMELFCNLSRKICKILFISYRLKKQIKFPKKITDFINIECGNITTKDRYPEFISKRFNTSIESLEEEFDNLSDHRAIRGKYMLQFMQHWLENVKHKIEKEHQIVSKKDFFNTEIRRFAAASKTPHELENCLAS